MIDEKNPNSPLPLPQEDGPALPLSSSWMGKLTRTVNALMRMRIKRGGDKDEVVWSDSNVVITLKDATGSGGGDLTIEEQDASPSVSDVTKIIVPNGTLTDNGSGEVELEFGSGITQVKIQADRGSTADYVSVKDATYNETTNAWDVTGTAYNVALPFLNRQASIPTSSHPDADPVLWPEYLQDDIVSIFNPIGGTGVEVSSVDLTYMIVSNKRGWCFEIPVCVAGGTIYYMIIPAWSCSTSSNASFTPVD